MSVFASRHFALAFLSLVLAACANAEPAGAIPATSAVGTDLGPSGRVVAGAAEGHAPYAQHRSNVQPVHEGHVHAQGTGTVNSVDAAGHKLNISHDPIPAIGFPAMTMDFAVAPSVNLGAIKPGSRVNFSLEQGEGGMYVVQTITPAGGAGR